MATHNSNSVEDLKSILLQISTRISGIDSKVTDISEKFQSVAERGADVKTALTLSKPEASIASNQDDSEEIFFECESTVCAIQNNVVNVHHDTQILSKYDLKSLTVNMPDAEVLQTGDNSQLIINKSDIDFDKFKEEVLDKMDMGNKEILDVLINFKDQYNKNNQSATGCPDEVSKALSYIINEVEKISRWQHRLVNQGVSISSQIKEVYHSVQGNNKSLTDQLSSVNSDLHSERESIRKLEEDKEMLKKQIDNLTDNKQLLQQQIENINITRGAIEFCFDISTMNNTVFSSKNHLMISNTYSNKTPERNETGSTYMGVFGDKPINQNQDMFFDVDVEFKIKQDLKPNELIFEVAVTNKKTLSSAVCDFTGWSFGARWLTNDDRISKPGSQYKYRLVVWRKRDQKCEIQISDTAAISHFSGSYRVDVKRSRGTLTIIDNRRKTTCYEFTDLEDADDLWPSFGVFNSPKVEVVLKLKPLLSYID